MKNEDGAEDPPEKDITVEDKEVSIAINAVKLLLLDALKDLNSHAATNSHVDDALGHELILLVSHVCKVHMRDAIRKEIDEALPRAFDLLKTVNQLEDARIQEILAETLHDMGNRISLKMKMEVVK